MNFQGLGKVDDVQKYLDEAFKNGMRSAEDVRMNVKVRSRADKSRKIETARVLAVGKSLSSSMEAIVRSFPSIDQLPPFYQELIRCTIDYELLKKSLGAVNWARKQVRDLMERTVSDLGKTTRLEVFNKVRVSFSGRVSSVLKQVKKNLDFLEQSRKIMKSFPALKTSVPTIVIAGMPNVGKSTLLAALTGSKPEIATYPFTTKRLNLGYDEHDTQFVDTPGLLDRPLHERNPIERQAALALKHLASAVIFVIDPTESCGYELREQKKLLEEIKRSFGVPFIVVSNKADTGASYEKAISISAKTGSGIDELKKAITVVISQKGTQEKLLE
ncbi:50S ribosome-binding GTPase [Candidatus Woesearchaeota archaeon]|nr:50S ribosome-binding GTPase [Candidatus Woesearchaeota archaeon]